MRKNGFLIVFSVIVGILLLFLFIVKISKPQIEEIDFKNLKEIKTGLVYIGSLNDEIKKELISLNNGYDINVYNVSSVEINKLNEYLNDIDLEIFDKPNVFIIYNESTPVWVGDSETAVEDLETNINKYINGKLSEDEIAYKIPENADEIINKINSKKYTILVIGQTDCNYCQLYIPVFNKVAKENNYDIYYVDSQDYNQSEYEKIINLDLDIPAKCTKTGVATKTTAGFPKPMTLLIKDGKTVDCLLGYKSESKLLDMLTSYNI